MMIAPTLLAARRMGAQGEEKAGQQRKGGPTRTPTLGADAPTGATWPRMSDARNSGVGLYSTGEAEGARDQSYPLTI